MKSSGLLFGTGVAEHTWDKSNGDTNYQVDGEVDQLKDSSIKKFESSFVNPHPSARSINESPMGKQINPFHLFSDEQSVDEKWVSRDTEAPTANIPKIAPDAPTDGTPGRAKFPPRTFLCIRQSAHPTIRIREILDTRKFQRQCR